MALQRSHKKMVSRNMSSKRKKKKVPSEAGFHAPLSQIDSRSTDGRFSTSHSFVSTSLQSPLLQDQQQTAHTRSTSESVDKKTTHAPSLLSQTPASSLMSSPLSSGSKSKSRKETFRLQMTDFFAPVTKKSKR
mmetsp:Transcript_38525/g.89554  ORF Transcript_38525/g.89554 Transcript_38525/m.89554 type:complete len:133 (-) Transcript_38525:614-1012(-)